MFSRFFDYINKKTANDDDDDDDDNNDDDEDGNGNDDNNNEKQNSDSNQNVSESNESLKKENCQTKYAYLDNVKQIDLNGLISMSDDLRSNVEILKNSYLAIVNSLVILNERRRQQRRRRRRQQQRKTSSQIRQQSSSNKTRRSLEKQESVQQQQQQPGRKLSDQEIYNDSEVMMIKMNNNNNKIDNNYNLIGENFSSTKKQTTTMEWNIEKFCDPKTREKEFQWLFDQAKQFQQTIQRFRIGKESINMDRFRDLVKQGKKLLQITEILKNNYSNNFLDIFRL
ncbi:uncharacterized protein LOC124491683 isoform X2 [Dermatophagoides farinae]|uniref:uncharacterized protein LOC124491683 isoform X2 n=1 Tax=Dermatophagoides farinae TaxID=6954 RepID=UPI003F620FB8